MLKLLTFSPALLALALFLTPPPAHAQAEETAVPNPLRADAALFEAAGDVPAFGALNAEAARASDNLSAWAEVYVDATASAGELGPIHTAFAQGGEDPRAPFFEQMVPHLRELGAALVRTDPLALTERITVHNGTCTIDWTNADRIVDALAAAGAKPMFNFTTCPDGWRDERGFPTNLEGWEYLVKAAVRHYNIERGDNIVYWELWNEPNHNIGMDEYFELYKVTSRAIKEVDPTAKVGGPAAAGLALDWLEAFLQYTSENDLPVDFISWHNYTIPPWQYPEESQTVRDLVEKYYDRPIETALTEWGVDWREIEFNDNHVSGAHAITSLFYMRGNELDIPMFFEPRDGWDWKGPDRRFWNRWGIITDKLDRKAGFHAYNMWDELGTNLVETSVTEDNIFVMATRDGDSLKVLLWNYPEAINRPDLQPIPDAHTGVTLNLRGLPGSSGNNWRMTRTLVDGTHSNAVHNLAREELETVETVIGNGDAATFHLALAPYGATFLTFEPTEMEAALVDIEPGAFEIFGGLRTTVALTGKDAGDWRVAEARNLDGIAFHLDDSDRGELVLTPPVVKEARFVHINATLENTAGEEREKEFAFMLLPAISVTPLDRVVDVTEAGAGASLPLELTNHTERALPVVMDATLPSGWWGYDHIETVLPPNRTVGLDWSVKSAPRASDNPMAAAGTYDVNLAFYLAEGSAVQPIEDLTLRVGVPGEVVKRDFIVIDGDLSDWETVPPIRFPAERKPGSASGPEDFDPTAYLAWNEEGLYIAGHVIDDQYLQEHVGLEMWRGDAMTFGMDMQRDAIGTGSYDDNDFEWGMAQTADGDEVRRWHSAAGVEDFEEELEIIIEDGVRIYEIFIPWENLMDETPEAGHVFGINIAVNDTDPDGSGTWSWGNPVTKFKNPAGLVPVRLVE